MCYGFSPAAGAPGLCYTVRMADNIINTFQARRQLAQALEELERTENEAEMAAAARAIVHGYPAKLVLAALVKLLDTGSSQLRGGLGHIAALLPKEKVVPALRAVAANRQQSPRARITAALLMERFVGEVLPSALMSDLQDSNEVAFQSLREALDEGRRNRHVLLEYVTQMRQTESAVAYMVMDMLERAGGEERVELLRLIAQDERRPVAEEALRRLERLGLPAAARALATLQWALPAELARQAERSARKLRFAGAAAPEPSRAGWRALLGLAEPGGMQSIWLVRMPRANSFGVLLGFVLGRRAGIVQMFGSETMALEGLPGAQPIGQMLTAELGGGRRAVLLEAPFEYGRWLVQEAALTQLSGGAAQPLPGEWQLYNDLVGEFGRARVPDGLADLFVEFGDAPAALDEEEMAAATEALLRHAAFAQWTSAGRTRRDRPAPPQALVQMALKELARSPEGDALRSALAEGLRLQAAWLRLEGDPAAEEALRLAATLATTPLDRHPLAARVIAARLNAQSG